MATWPELVAYLRTRYKIQEPDDSMVHVEFATREGRSQMAFIFKHTLDEGKEEWAVIESPFAPIAGTDLEAVIREVATNVVGGIGTVADHLTLRHAVPLANLDTNEIDRPLILVTWSADALEAQFMGGDRL